MSATTIEHGVLSGVTGTGLVSKCVMRSGFTELANNISTLAGFS